MSGNCTFIRMLQEKDKGDGLKITIKDLTIGADKSIIFTVDPEFFLQIPNSPFAYWVSNCLCQKFEEFSQFEQNYGEVRMGLGTRDDFRFIRLSWEITPKKINFTPRTNINFYEEHKIAEIYLKETKNGKKWSFFAKGGEYSPYYSDIHLVVNWENEGNEIKDLRFNNGKIKSCVRNEDYYYKSGLTWSRRTTSRFNLKVLPAGAIFADLGNIIIPFNEKLKLPYLGLFLSDIYFSLMKLSLGAEDAAARTYDIGIIQRLPVPKLSDNNITLLTNLMIESILLKMKVLSLVEIARIFTLPVFNVQNNSIKDCFSKSKKSIDEIEMILDENQSKIDQIAYNIYEIKENDRQLIETNVDFRPSPLEGLEINYNSISANILSYILGSIFGRWDIRYATGEKEPPELPDPFAPLPACSPGMLQGEDGLPLAPHEIATDYPLVVDADGILVDDEGHSDDIIARIRDVLILIWADRADAIEKEACEILGVKSLRDYFRKPGAGGFWDGHVKRYSKSRRKAPIYWLLQSAKKNYAIWIYYPMMDGDTLYKALRYAKDKLSMEEQRLDDMQSEREQLGTGGAAVKKLEKEIDSQEAFISELYDFVEKLERAANLDLISEHDDGVVLTIAPLWEIVPWKEPKKYWDELIDGKYEWSSIGKQLREKGMVKRS